MNAAEHLAATFVDDANRTPRQRVVIAAAQSAYIAVLAQLEEPADDAFEGLNTPIGDDQWMAATADIDDMHGSLRAAVEQRLSDWLSDQGLG